MSNEPFAGTGYRCGTGIANIRYPEGKDPQSPWIFFLKFSSVAASDSLDYLVEMWYDDREANRELKKDGKSGEGYE